MQPAVRLWADQETFALRQVETRLPVQGNYRTVTESYATNDDQASPVFGPLTALPVDLPLFLRDQTKALSDFSYEATGVPPG